MHTSKQKELFFKKYFLFILIKCCLYQKRVLDLHYVYNETITYNSKSTTMKKLFILIALNILTFAATATAQNIQVSVIYCTGKTSEKGGYKVTYNEREKTVTIDSDKADAVSSYEVLKSKKEYGYVRLYTEFATFTFERNDNTRKYDRCIMVSNDLSVVFIFSNTPNKEKEILSSNEMPKDLCRSN